MFASKSILPVSAPKLLSGATRRGKRIKGVRARAAAITEPLTLRTGSCCLPHPDKVQTGGEDAFFVSSDNKVVGVADGVGGWQASGIDPGDYSRNLMRVACDYFESGDANRTPADSKQWEETMREAIGVAHRKTRMPGSSTACVLALNSAEKYISAAHLGDSGFIIVRNGTVVFQTPPLQHFFDCPRQLGACPEYVDATDYPSDAETYTLNVMPGDIIVAATDGLWDNCPLAEIVQLLPDSDDMVSSAAEVIAAAARTHAENDGYDSPYTQSARANGLDIPFWQKVLSTRIEDGKVIPGKLKGGKMDDITVVVARVSDDIPPRATTEAAIGPPAEAAEALGQAEEVLERTDVPELPTSSGSDATAAVGTA